MSEIATDIVNKIFAGEPASEVTELIKSALYTKADEDLASVKSGVFAQSMADATEPDEEQDESSESETEETEE
jgi:hypothetical protein